MVGSHILVVLEIIGDAVDGSNSHGGLAGPEADMESGHLSLKTAKVFSLHHQLDQIKTETYDDWSQHLLDSS